MHIFSTTNKLFSTFHTWYLHYYLKHDDNDKLANFTHTILIVHKKWMDITFSRLKLSILIGCF